MLEGGVLVFQSATGNRISTGDPDAGTSALEVTLAASTGLLSLGNPGAVQFSKGDGTADAVMTFRGSQSKINDAISNITFLPPPSYVGTATLTISTNDLGHTGSGGAKSDTDKVTINVASINLVALFHQGKRSDGSGRQRRSKIIALGNRHFGWFDQ